MYPSHDAMADQIVEDLRQLDQKEPYESYNLTLRPIYVARRSAAHLEARLRDFHDGRYLLHPWYSQATDADETDPIH